MTVKKMNSILVVDDEEIVRFALTGKLGENGFDVCEACNGRHAVEVFGTKEFDAVLLDLKMPEMDGIETLKELRKLEPDVPVIMLTAFGDIPTAVESIKLGAYDFVEKPPQISRLMVTIRRAIENRELAREITALGKTVKETEVLREAYGRLKEADAVKTSFLSSISHELRTPLTSIVGYAKIVRKKLKKVLPPAGEYSGEALTVEKNMEIIIAEAERLTGLINNVLDITGMEAGKTEWKSERVYIPDLVESALSSVSLLCGGKGIELHKEIGKDLPEITGDRGKLAQVLKNLLLNAVNFTDKGAVTVRVRKMRYSEKDFVEISIIDSGIGIQEKDRENVFEKFRQVGDTLTDKPKGAGLGLSICKYIVEHHGGEIWFESRDGKGSVFSFTVPVG
ncbi:MAG: hypothetical protein A2X55_09585 [Nitrospirae bacterium GWB2_47_37]|nr:MAG: hypothetical protein A2Z82_10020 [Nitrospirae bacterium GWA2_46_11]OGW23212.1 MAG: hypothetical protein A2X55_09585 [Nitrospirae bacterium GWB2_47_37]HAK87764.1 hypothetical protein [Nitrospiraceae bacterium]